MNTTNRCEWSFVVGDKRHHLFFLHNTFTGKQILKLNGKLLHKVNVRYRLTGNIRFRIDDASALLCITVDANLFGGFLYRFYLNELLVDPTAHESGESSSFDVPCKMADGTVETIQVEFEHKNFDVWVGNDRFTLDNGKLAAEFLDGDDQGSAYSFELPNGCPAIIEVRPTGRRGGSAATMFIGDDREPVPVAKGIGAETAESPASASKR